MKRKVKGELTVFLSLVFLLLLTLVGALIESASIQVGKSEKRADASRAAESVFAEYQRDLLEQYGIFAIEGSYETGHMSKEHILNRLSYYGAENMETEIVAIRYLTDDLGKEFYRQAVECEKTKTGISMLEELVGKQSMWEKNEKQAEEYTSVDEQTKETLDSMLTEKLEDNPIDLLAWMKSDVFLTLLLPEGFALSGQVWNQAELVSGRTLNQGYGNLYEKKESATDRVLFNLYLSEKFGNACEEKENRHVKYEMEYLIEGKASDKENLEAVLAKICGIRFASNYVFLLGNHEKQVEAEVLAGTICTLVAIPGVIPVVKQALLITWAYGEAMLDTRELLSGNSVPMIKTEETWNLSLENLMSMKEIGLPEEESEKEEGETYEMYIQMLLGTKKKEDLVMRSMDLIERNIHEMGKDYFRMDNCITGATFQVSSPFRRSVRYDFQISYQYH